MVNRKHAHEVTTVQRSIKSIIMIMFTIIIIIIRYSIGQIWHQANGRGFYRRYMAVAALSWLRGATPDLGFARPVSRGTKL